MINNNRQAGRRRGRGGQQQRPQGNSGARDTGNRIDNRSRGNAAQLLEKYKSLARDSQMSGDRVNTEYYLQFADHYFRVLAETRSRFDENRTPMQGGANTFQDDEQEYNDEGEPVARAEQPRQNDGNRQDQPRQDGNRQDRQSNGGQQGYQGERQSEGDRGTQNDRGQNDRGQNDRGQNNGAHNNGSQNNGGQRAERQDRQSGERQYNDERPRRQNDDQAADRYVRNDRSNRNDRFQSEIPAQSDAASIEDAPVAEPVVEEAPRAAEPQQEAPRRRGRPRREPVAETPAAFEADRLPPALTVASAPAAEPANDLAGEPEEKPRRRRGRPPASEVTSA